jgi:pentose-5-phosphate-3-epimerase
MPKLKKILFILLFSTSLQPALADKASNVTVERFSGKAVLIQIDGVNKLIKTSNLKGKNFMVSGGPNESNFYTIVDAEVGIEYLVLGSNIITSNETLRVECRESSDKIVQNQNLLSVRGAGQTC